MNRTLMVLAVVVLAGYASSFASQSQCERKVANDIARELGTRHIFVWPGKPDEVLRRNGFDVESCTTRKYPDCFPWVEIRHAETRYPFVVDVRWGFNGG